MLTAIGHRLDRRRWPPAARRAGAPSLQDRSPWALCAGHAGARLRLGAR